MRASHARIIRAGIMSKCLPYIGFGSDYILDYVALERYRREYRSVAHTKLARRARERTKIWEKVTQHG